MAAGGKPNTRIDYLYRDAGNYKAHGHVVVAGRVRFGDLKPFLDCGEYFVPPTVGIPPLNIEGEPRDPRLDHPWHELSPEGFSGTGEPPTIDATAAQLIGSFRRAASRGRGG